MKHFDNTRKLTLTKLNLTPISFKVNACLEEVNQTYLHPRQNLKKFAK